MKLLQMTTPQRRFEGVKRWACCRINFEVVPVPDSAWEVWVGIRWRAGVRFGESRTVTPSRCRQMSQVVTPRDVNQVVSHLVHHMYAAAITAFLEWLPLEMFQHGGYAASCPVISHDKAGWAALDLLKLVDVAFCMWVPCSASKFDRWSNEGCVDCFFDFPACVAQVSGEESLGALCFLGDGVNVGIEAQFWVDMHSKILSRVGNL